MIPEGGIEQRLLLLVSCGSAHDRVLFRLRLFHVPNDGRHDEHAR